MTTKTTAAKATVAPQADATQEPQADAALSVKAILAAINDGDGDPDTVKALNAALYRFGAQDPSMELPRSWQRVQRRIGAETLDGIATAEQVAQFANRAALTVAR